MLTNTYTQGGFQWCPWCHREVTTTRRVTVRDEDNAIHIELSCNGCHLTLEVQNG